MKIPFTSYEVSLKKNLNPKNVNELFDGVMRNRQSADPTRDMSGYKLTPDSCYMIYASQSDVYSCVNKIKWSIGAAGLAIYDRETGEEADDPSIIMKVTYVLTRMSSLRALLARIGQDLGAMGNAYGEKGRNLDGSIFGLRMLDPRTVYIVADAMGNVVRYIQRSGADIVEFQPEEIIHFKLDTDPRSELFGFSPAEAVVWDARTDMQAMLTNYFFFENNAVPSHLFMLEDDVGPEGIEMAKSAINSQFGGAENRNKSAIMKGVKEIKQISLSNADMQMEVLRRFSTEKVCAAYGVPRVLLGYTDGVNYTNHEGQMAQFITQTVRPRYEDLIAEELTRQLLPELDIDVEKYELSFKQISLEDVDSLHNRARLGFASGIFTLNEARAEVGLRPAEHEYADQHLIMGGANAVFLDEVGVNPTFDPNDPEQLKSLTDIFPNAVYKPKEEVS